jgi:hypothetical protein
MSNPLLPDALWNLIQPLRHLHRADPTEADLACQTVLASRGFSSCSAAAYRGRCCHRNWAAVLAWPAGGGYATGKRRASGN